MDRGILSEMLIRNPRSDASKAIPPKQNQQFLAVIDDAVDPRIVENMLQFQGSPYTTIRRDLADNRTTFQAADLILTVTSKLLARSIPSVLKKAQFGLEPGGILICRLLYDYAPAGLGAVPSRRNEVVDSWLCAVLCAEFRWGQILRMRPTIAKGADKPPCTDILLCASPVRPDAIHIKLLRRIERGRVLHDR